MGSRVGNDDDVIADINVTPFVDVVLVVLIIFMVASPIIAKQAIQVALPDAATGAPADDTSLGLTLTVDGKLLLDGDPVTIEQLDAAIAEAKVAAKAQKTDVVCLIAADKGVAHGRVVWLIDFVRSREVGKFAINIDKAEMVAPDPATHGEGVGWGEKSP
jgi:biopolymer transport protein ExbD